MRWTLGVAALAALFAVAGAKAASIDRGNLIVKAGTTRPIKSSVKQVGNDWFTYGAQYNLGDPNSRSVNGLELLYTKKSDTVTSVGSLGIPTDYHIYSLMLNHTVRSVPADGVALGNVFFYGAGLGADFIQVKMDDPNPGGHPVDKKTTLMAGNLFVGYEFASNLQIEAKYQLPFGKVEDTRIDTVQFMLGMRF